MKNIITLVSTLLLTLTLFCVKTTAQTQGMYDINVTLNLDINSITNTVALSKKLSIHQKVRFIIHTKYSYTRGYFEPEVGATPINFGDGSIIEYQYSSGGDKVLEFYQLSQENPNVPAIKTVSVSEILTVKQAQAGVTYQSPDDIWVVGTADNFAPMCESVAFPNGAPQKGYASVYIKYGAGHNGKLVRPIIFVDGIDFDPTTYTGPVYHILKISSLTMI